ncbi:MAG: hypothetical protein WD626_03185 [Bauldia sp.]
MTTATDIIDTDAERRASRRERAFAVIGKAAVYLNVVGFGWLVPLLRMAAGDNVRLQMRELWQQAGIPLIGIVVFLSAWAWLAPTVVTNHRTVPRPPQVWEQ